jgi:hypothetical protein
LRLILRRENPRFSGMIRQGRFVHQVWATRAGCARCQTATSAR